jgi:hypothetical protein
MVSIVETVVMAYSKVRASSPQISLLIFNPSMGILGIEREEGLTISSQRPRSSSAFCTKLGYISFNAAELNAGANIRLYHQPALMHEFPEMVFPVARSRAWQPPERIG